jgi:Tol biopolymer transport system component
MNYDSCCLDLTRDASAITDVQNSTVSNLWIASATMLDSPTQITSGDPVMRRQAWMPDDKTIIYQTLKGNLYSIRTDGSAATLLTDQHKIVGGPSVCGDGRYVVFESSRDGSIWRMGPDGFNPTRLTDGKLDHFPGCSPDGKWVYYTSERSGRLTLWRIPIDGGKSTELMQEMIYAALLSPSGRLVFYLTFEGGPPRWVVISANGGKRVYSFERPVPSVSFHGPSWAPDERGLDYVSSRGGVSNIWRQPLDGGAPKQITHFTSGQIVGFAWSRNGKWLSLARGETSSDVILLSDFR